MLPHSILWYFSVDEDGSAALGPTLALDASGNKLQMAVNLLSCDSRLNTSCHSVNASTHSPIIQCLILLTNRILCMYLCSLHVAFLDCL